MQFLASINLSVSVLFVSFSIAPFTDSRPSIDKILSHQSYPVYSVSPYSASQAQSARRGAPKSGLTNPAGPKNHLRSGQISPSAQSLALLPRPRIHDPKTRCPTEISWFFFFVLLCSGLASFFPSPALGKPALRSPPPELPFPPPTSPLAIAIASACSDRRSRSVYLPPLGLRTAGIPERPVLHSQCLPLPSFSPTRLDPTTTDASPPQHCQGMRSHADQRRSRRKTNW